MPVPGPGLVAQWHSLVCSYAILCWAGTDIVESARERENGRVNRERGGGRDRKERKERVQRNAAQHG